MTDFAHTPPTTVLDVVISSPITIEVGAAARGTAWRVGGRARLAGGIVAAFGMAATSYFLGPDIVEAAEAAARWVCERMFDYIAFLQRLIPGPVGR